MTKDQLKTLFNNVSTSEKFELHVPTRYTVFDKV